MNTDMDCGSLKSGHRLSPHGSWITDPVFNSRPTEFGSLERFDTNSIGVPLSDVYLVSANGIGASYHHRSHPLLVSVFIRGCLFR
jgi:hypothetical protein